MTCFFREFWNELLESQTVNKIGFRMKEFFVELFSVFKFDHNKGRLDVVDVLVSLS